MKILITGASGFIGSFLCEEGLRQGHQIWAGVRKGSSRSYLRDPRLHFAMLDFNNPEKLKAELAEHNEEHNGWDVIIHCAGVTKCLNPEDFERNNYQYTRNFVDMLLLLIMSPRQLVYVS